MIDQNLTEKEYAEGKLDKRYFFIYVVISIPFILLFYDTFNLNANIFSTENLILGLNPYSHQSLLVIGYTALPYNYLLTWLYNNDGFNAYLVVIVIKLICMIFTIVSAFLIYKILLIRNVSYKKAKAAMLAFLFSPFVIFVDYIWVQPEFYSIFFILLGIYVFEKYNLSGGKFIDLIVISFSLLIAGITFYFPLLLIPGYLIYIRGKLTKVKFFAALIMSGLVLLIPILLFNLKTTFSSTIAGKNVNIFPYSIVSLILTPKDPVGEIELIIEVALIILAFLLPVLMYRYEKSVYLSQIIYLSIVFSFQVTGINPDTFIFLIPFIILEYSLIERNNYSFWKIILLQMILLPEYINLQFLNGPGYVTGIYYWIYFWYHQNIVILATIPYRQLITQFLNASTFALMYFLIFYFIKSGNYKEMDMDESKTFKSRKELRLKLLHAKTGKVWINLIVVSIIFIILLLSFPLSLSHNNSYLETKDKFPAMIYISNDPQNSQYIMQNKNSYCYFPQNNTLSFFQGNIVSYLYKNISNENYMMNGNISFKYPAFIIRPQEIFQLGNSFAGITKFLIINKSTQTLPMTQEINVNTSAVHVTENLGCYFLVSNGTEINQLNGGSSLKSSFNYSLLFGRTAFLMIGIQNFTNYNSPILGIKLGSTCNELSAGNDSFYFGKSSDSIQKEELTQYSASLNQSIEINGKVVSVSWNLVGITFINSSTGLLILNGLSIPMTFDNPNSMNTTCLNIGDSQTNITFSSSTNTSFYTTDPYLIKQNDSLIIPGIFYLHNKTTVLFPINGTASEFQRISFTINETGNTSTLIFGHLAFETFKHITYVAFGQINTSSFTFNMKMSLIKIQKETQTLNYSFIILIYALILPISVLLIWAIDIYIEKSS